MFSRWIYTFMRTLTRFSDKPLCSNNKVHCVLNVFCLSPLLCWIPLFINNKRCSCWNVQWSRRNCVIHLNRVADKRGLLHLRNASSQISLWSPQSMRTAQAYLGRNFVHELSPAFLKTRLKDNTTAVRRVAITAPFSVGMNAYK